MVGYVCLARGSSRQADISYSTTLLLSLGTLESSSLSHNAKRGMNS